ncbi:methyltransferase domain-containing protein [Streptomyces sp. NPDC007983]|uniref:class I SAM-dependent methyltransferase n=1 Tax=Streptomyces sp. NPDC007983 TaxID=3364800 RepID=UPI0036F0DA40
MYSKTEDEQQEGFDNARPEAQDQLSLLSDILDRHTFRVLNGLGVGHGRRCWDIGAGNGSVARWLTARVGTTGQVVASDLDPGHVPEHPRIEPLRHDLTLDPWPGPPFDLIHARLLLMHLPAREEIAVRLAGHLRPGGVLVLTDWYCDCAAGVVASPVDAYTAEIWQRFHDGVHALGEKTGMDLTWAARTADVIRAAGYEVGTELFQDTGRGGTPTARLARLHSFMLEPHLTANAGLTPDDLAVIRANLLDPEFEMATYLTHTTIVRAAAEVTA